MTTRMGISTAARGWRTLGFLLLLSALSPPAGAVGSSIHVTLAPVVGAVPPGEGHLHVLLPDEEHRLALPDSLSLVVPVPDGASAVLRAEVPGFWSPEVAAVGVAEPQEVTLRLFPAAVLEGRMTTPRGARPLREMVVTVDPPWQAPENGKASVSIPHASEPCAITLSGRFRCSVPAGRLDLRLRVSGFVSLFFWDLTLQAGAAHQLGDLALAPGASVVAWVQDAEGEPLKTPVTATLEPATVFPGASRGRGLERLALRGKADERGFLHLQGVPAGAYRLQVSAEGFAPVTRRLEVVEGREVRLPAPLVLSPPARLELTLVPPEDPYGRPWEVRLWPPNDERAGPWQRVTEKGRLRYGPLAPGRYRVQVESGTGRTRHGWWSGELDVATGGTAEEIRLPVVEIWGTVRLGEEVVEAVVQFGERQGFRKLRFDADPEGVFAGYLPEEGEWPVSVYTPPTGWRTLPAVEVVVPEGHRHAELELVLPNNTLPGEVVDVHGEPLPDVRVTGYHTDERFEISPSVTDEEGRFRLRSVAPGRVMLSALGSDGASAGAMVTVPEEGSTEPVRLVLQELHHLQGRVIGPTGPVPGALVIALPRGMGLFMLEGGRILSDPNGRFELRVPTRATTLDVAVLAPGWPAPQLRVSPPWPDELVVEVRPGGGTLELVLPGGGQAILRHQGAELPLGMFSRWGRQSSGEDGEQSWHLPAMAPGTWEVCIRGLSTGAPPCQQGFLPPGGVLELAIGGPPGPRAASSTP